MSATRWWWLAVVIVLAPACRSAVDADRRAGESTGSAPGESAGSASGGSGGSSLGGSGGGSSAGSPGGSSGGSGGSSSGGDGGAAPSFCTFTVSGAIEVTVTTGYPASYGGVMCGADVDGGVGYFSVDLEMVHGPGSYPLVGPPEYQFELCSDDDQSCTDDRYSGAAWSCSAEITIAPPVVPTWGERLEGTVSCQGLVSEADATETIAVTSSFSFVMSPPPC